jgi:hypothetical protein
VWTTWETGDDCVSRYGVSGANALHVAHWSTTGQMLLAPTVIDPAVDAGSEAVALALQGRGGVAYYPQPGTVEPYLVATSFDGPGRAGAPQRVNYDGAGKAANPRAQSVHGRPLVIWQKVRGDSAVLEGTAYHPKQPPDLLTRLGLNIGNLWGNIALVIFGSLAGGIALTVINVFLLLPLAVVWLLLRRLPGTVRWPLYTAAIAALLVWIFGRSGPLPSYVLVITALGVPYDWLGVAGAVFVSAWSGHYLLGRQESGMRATAMALIALYVVAAMYAVIFIQGQITKI